MLSETAFNLQKSGCLIFLAQHQLERMFADSYLALIAQSGPLILPASVTSSNKHPRSDIVIAFFSSAEPWGAQLAAKVPFEQILEKYRAQETKRRHLCHEIARLLQQ